MERAHANVHSIGGGANLSISLQSFYAWWPVYTTNIHLFIDNVFLICQASHYPAEPLKSCFESWISCFKGNTTQTSCPAWKEELQATHGRWVLTFFSWILIMFWENLAFLKLLRPQGHIAGTWSNLIKWPRASASVSPTLNFPELTNSRVYPTVQAHSLLTCVHKTFSASSMAEVMNVMPWKHGVLCFQHKVRMLHHCWREQVPGGPSPCSVSICHTW